MTASKAMAWTRANLELLNLSFMASPTEGFELNQQLKRNTDLASIPIVMITSLWDIVQNKKPAGIDETEERRLIGGSVFSSKHRYSRASSKGHIRNPPSRILTFVKPFALRMREAW